jgi:hypothetical protein
MHASGRSHYDAQQLAQLEFLLLGDLRQILGEPATPDTRHYLATVLDLMFEMLPYRFAMKEAGGYLDEVTKKFPGWDDQVAALCCEHGLLYEDLRDLRRDVSDESRFDRGSEAIVARIGEWMERYARHEQEERRLTQLAANLELGVGA